MRGKRLGWSVVAALVILTVGGFHWVRKQLADVTPVTAFLADPAAALSLDHPMPPRSVVLATQNCDAGEWYRHAIDLYLQNPTQYEMFMLRARGSAEVRTLEALGPLLEAADCSTMTLFAASPDDVVRYGERPRLDAIRTIGRIANRVGALLVFEKRPEEARTYHRAAFALGAGLYTERITLDELLAGIELMSEASAGLLGAGSDDPALSAFRAANIGFYENQIKPAQRILTSVDAAMIARHGGDVLYIAREGTERMWRIEAIFALGRMRYHAGRVGDQRAAERVLEQLEKDPDPLIRSAAEAARRLTIEQYRSLR